jgi:hypothetical protein
VPNSRRRFPKLLIRTELSLTQDLWYVNKKDHNILCPKEIRQMLQNQALRFFHYLIRQEKDEDDAKIKKKNKKAKLCLT